MRSPNGVRYNSHATAVTISSPSGINGLCSSPDISAVELVPAENPATLGEFDELSNTSLRKYLVRPTASRLIAIPDTTWSALKRIVDTACSNPSAIPPAMPHSTPIHGFPE